jgi:hypothetical protein
MSSVLSILGATLAHLTPLLSGAAAIGLVFVLPGPNPFTASSRQGEADDSTGMAALS